VNTVLAHPLATAWAEVAIFQVVAHAERHSFGMVLKLNQRRLVFRLDAEDDCDESIHGF